MSLFAKSKELREKRGKLVKEAGDLLAAAHKENRQLTAEEATKWDALHAGAEELRGQIEQVERQIEAERSLAARQEQDPPSPGQPGQPGTDPEQRTRLERDAFRRWCAGGMNALTAEQRDVVTRRVRELPSEARALSVGTDGSGGYTVPDGFQANLVEAMLSYGGIYAAAELLPTDAGNDIPWPSANDTGNKGARIAENTQITTEAEPTFAQTLLQAYIYHSKIVRVPITLLQDSAFDIEAKLTEWLAVRLWRIINEECTTGTGSSQPNGIVTASTSGKTAAATTAITYLELLDLEHSVDPLYRANASWMFHDNTLLALKKLVDSDGRPLWSAGMAVGQPDRIDGYPYAINQAMASTIEASAKTVLFGDLKSYKIRQVRNVQLVRFGEKYMDYLQVGFLAFLRADGDLVDAGTHPVKYLAQAAA